MQVSRSGNVSLLEAGLPLLVVLVLLGCTGGQPPADTAQTPVPLPVTSAPVQTSTVTRPEDAGAVSELCGLFTVDEIAAVIDTPVEPGHVAGPLETACQWSAVAGGARVLIQKAEARYWEDGKGVEGYRELEGIGERAYVVPDPLGGVRASAVTADSAYWVIAGPYEGFSFEERTPVAGPADEDIIQLLRAFIARSSP